MTCCCLAFLFLAMAPQRSSACHRESNESAETPPTNAGCCVSSPPLPDPHRVILRPADAEGLRRSSPALWHRFPKGWAHIWAADHRVERRAEIYVPHLDMHQLYNRQGSPET